MYKITISIIDINRIYMNLHSLKNRKTEGYV